MTKIEQIKKMAHKELNSGCLRNGQALINALHIVDKQAYNAITTTIFDCFYSDNNIPQFWAFVHGWFAALGEE